VGVGVIVGVGVGVGVGGQPKYSKYSHPVESVKTTSNDVTSSNGKGTSKVYVGGILVDPVTITQVVYVISHT
jgi:hypothetical protein